MLGSHVELYQQDDAVAPAYQIHIYHCQQNSHTTNISSQSNKQSDFYTMCCVHLPYSVSSCLRLKL